MTQIEQKAHELYEDSATYDDIKAALLSVQRETREEYRKALLSDAPRQFDSPAPAPAQVGTEPPQPTDPRDEQRAREIQVLKVLHESITNPPSPLYDDLGVWQEEIRLTVAKLIDSPTPDAKQGETEPAQPIGQCSGPLPGKGPFTVVQTGEKTKFVTTAGAEAPAKTSWLPMDTAPRDGTAILLAFRHGVQSVRWTEAESGIEIWCVDDNKFGPYAVRGYRESDCLGWMPLPTLQAVLAPHPDTLRLDKVARWFQQNTNGRLIATGQYLSGDALRRAIDAMPAGEK